MRSFIVEIHYDTHSGQWSAISDELGLVTEAESYEALTHRAREIAPELYALNGHGSEQDNFSLDFHQLIDAHEAM